MSPAVEFTICLAWGLLAFAAAFWCRFSVFPWEMLS